jgi:hypothetical protein
MQLRGNGIQAVRFQYSPPSWLVPLSGRFLFPWLRRLNLDEVAFILGSSQAGHSTVGHRQWLAPRPACQIRAPFTQTSAAAGQNPTEITTDGIVTIQVLSGECSVAGPITNTIGAFACHIRQVLSKPANHIVSL